MKQQDTWFELWQLPTGEGPGVLVDSRVAMSHHCVLVAKEPNGLFNVH